MANSGQFSSSVTIDIASLPTGLFIEGAWRDGKDGRSVEVIDTSSGRSIVSVADATIGDAMEAIAAADRAGKDWAATPPRRRSDILRRCFELMIENRDMLAELISLENGKTLSDAQGEVTYAAEFFRWFSEEAVRLNVENDGRMLSFQQLERPYKVGGINARLDGNRLDLLLVTDADDPGIPAALLSTSVAK